MFCQVDGGVKVGFRHIRLKEKSIHHSKHGFIRIEDKCTILQSVIWHGLVSTIVHIADSSRWHSFTPEAQDEQSWVTGNPSPSQISQMVE